MKLRSTSARSYTIAAIVAAAASLKLRALILCVARRLKSAKCARAFSRRLHALDLASSRASDCRRRRRVKSSTVARARASHHSRVAYQLIDQ